MSECHVRDNAFAEESRFRHAASRPIEKLIRDDHVEGCVLFLQRPNGRGRKDSLDAQQLHAIDVRAKRNFCRRESMSDAVPRKKRDPLAFERAENKLIGRTAEWSLNLDLVDLSQLRHLVKAAAADNSDFCCRHEYLCDCLAGGLVR